MHLFDNMMRMMGLLINTHTHTHTPHIYITYTPGVGDGQGGLTCCDSWGHKESDTTEWLN